MSLGGLEPGLVAVALFGVMRGLLRNNLSELVMYSTLGLLTRMDFAVFLFAFCISDLLSRQTRTRVLMCVLTTILVLGSLTLARYVYYGELVPNTAVLKVSGFPLVDRLRVGVISSLVTIFRSLSAPIIALLILRIKPNRYVTFATLFIVAYNTYVGGDAWEALEIDNRFLTPVSLALCIEAAMALTAVEFKKLPILAGMTVAVSCTLIAILIARYPSTSPLYDTSLKSVPLLFLILIACSFFVPVRVRWFVVVVSVMTIGWQNGIYRVYLQRSSTRVQALSLVDMSTKLDSIDKRAVVAVAHAGIPAYVMNRPLHDLLGKCDKQIARTRAKGLQIGHNKHDTHYSLFVVRPDIVLERFSMTADELVKAGYRPVRIETRGLSEEIWIRSDSQYVTGL